MKNTLVILTGPSCSGKSTLEALLVKRGYNRLLSSTTRPMRQGEQDLREYRFLGNEEFDKRVANDEFVEVVNFNGNQYGVQKIDTYDALHKGNAVVVVEPHGKEQFEQFAARNDIRVVRVFVTNPQRVILERFLSRFGEDYIVDAEKAIETYASRLAVMQTVEAAWHFDMSKEHYDLVFTEFNATNCILVLQDIQNLVTGKIPSKIAA